MLVDLVIATASDVDLTLGNISCGQVDSETVENQQRFPNDMLLDHSAVSCCASMLWYRLNTFHDLAVAVNYRAPYHGSVAVENDLG